MLPASGNRRSWRTSNRCRHCAGIQLGIGSINGAGGGSEANVKLEDHPWMKFLPKVLERRGFHGEALEAEIARLFQTERFKALAKAIEKLDPP